MKKTSKAVVTVTFVAVFCMLVWCMVQISATQRGILYLTEQLALEIAQPGPAPSAEPTSAQDWMDGVQAGKEELTPSASVPSWENINVYPSPTAIPAPIEDAGWSPPASDPVEDIVYWVPNGKVWHVSPNCRTLARSTTIYEGTIEESGKSRACHVCGG
jgi:hypothetical protein